MFLTAPIYLLTVAVERVKDAIPDQDADDWLKDAIAADRIGWAYIVWEEEQGFKLQSFIDIPPSAVIIEGPNLRIDWPKGMVTAKRRGRVVECPIVVSRRDLDQELTNFTVSQETADLTRSGMARAEDRAVPSKARQGGRKKGSRGYDLADAPQDVEVDAIIQNRIKGVLAKAKARWPKPPKRPGVNQMARLLVDGQPRNQVEGFGQDAIRKILAGTYKPAKDRSIPGLSSG